MKGSCI